MCFAKAVYIFQQRFLCVCVWAWAVFVNQFRGLGVCKCARAIFFLFFFFSAADASQCVKCRGLNPSGESNKGGTPRESNRHSFLAQNRFQCSPLRLGGERPTAQATTTSDQLRPFLFIYFFCYPSYFPTWVVSHCQTLFTQWLCTADSISRDASLERKISPTVTSSMQITRGPTNPVLVELRGVCYSESARWHLYAENRYNKLK